MGLPCPVALFPRVQAAVRDGSPISIVRRGREMVRKRSGVSGVGKLAPAQAGLASQQVSGPGPGNRGQRSGRTDGGALGRWLNREYCAG